MSEASIEQRAGYLAVDCGQGSNGRAIAEIYRELAVQCVTKQVSRVLVKAADGSVEGQHALRDALTSILLAGMPPDFRLAMVTGLARMESFFVELQRDLQRLSVHIAVFSDENEALQWLHARAARPAPR